MSVSTSVFDHNLELLQSYIKRPSNLKFTDAKLVQPADQLRNINKFTN